MPAPSRPRAWRGSREPRVAVVLILVGSVGCAIMPRHEICWTRDQDAQRGIDACANEVADPKRAGPEALAQLASAHIKAALSAAPEAHTARHAGLVQAQSALQRLRSNYPQSPWWPMADAWLLAVDRLLLDGQRAGELGGLLEESMRAQHDLALASQGCGERLSELSAETDAQVKQLQQALANEQKAKAELERALEELKRIDMQKRP